MTRSYEMSKTDLKRLQAISHRMNPNHTEISKQFLHGLKSALAKRGYRADLSISTDSRNTLGTFTASVSFNPDLGHPGEEDLVTLVAQSYPAHEIDWELVEVDSDQGTVVMMLQPSQEVIPVSSVVSIPAEFKSIGTGLYKRAVDSTVSEIWTLKKTDDGLALYRSQNDIEVHAEDNQIKAGDVVNTPYGPGKVVRLEEGTDNAYVLVGNKKRLVAGKDLLPYDIDKEKSKLMEYYKQIYGPEFSEDLIKNYVTRNK